MAQNFNCKTIGCTKIVCYTPDNIPVFITRKKVRSSKSGIRKIRSSKTVYLTCTSGHTNSYLVRG